MENKKHLDKLIINGVPLSDTKGYLNHRVSLIRKDNPEFDSYLKELYSLLNELGDERLNDIKSFLLNDGYINQVLPFFDFFRKQYNYGYSPIEIILYLNELIGISETFFKSEYKVLTSEIVLKRLAGHNPVEIKKYHLDLVPKGPHNFFFEVKLNAKINDMEIELRTSNSKIKDSYSLFVSNSIRKGDRSVKRILFEESVCNAIYRTLIKNEIANPIKLEGGFNWLRVDDEAFLRSKREYDLDDLVFSFR